MNKTVLKKFFLLYLLLSPCFISMHVSNHFRFCYDYLDAVFHKAFTLEVMLLPKTVILFFRICEGIGFLRI